MEMAAKTNAYIILILLMILSFHQQELRAQCPPIQTGTYYMPDSTVFIVSERIVLRKLRITDGDTLFPKQAALTIEEHALLTLPHNLFKVTSSIPLKELVIEAIDTHRLAHYADREEEISVFVRFTEGSDAFQISFWVNMGSIICLDDLYNIKNNIMRYYRPEIVSESDYYKILKQFSDNTSINFKLELEKRKGQPSKRNGP